MGTHFPFCSALGLEMLFKSPGKHLELAIGPYRAQGPYIKRVGIVQPISALSPCWLAVCVPGKVTVMSPQGQPRPLFQVCGVAPMVEVQEGWGAPWPFLPLPGTAVSPAGGRGPASTGHVTGGDRDAIYTLLYQAWVWRHQ